MGKNHSAVHADKAAPAAPLRQEAPAAKKIRFYLSCHKPCMTVENEIVRPVRQADLIAFLQNGTEEDRFMAAHANEYCELLTQYWAWKYEEADIYGFGHYRRLFSFLQSGPAGAGESILHAKYLSKRTARLHGLDDPAAIRAALHGCDIVLPQPFTYDVSIYRQYACAEKLHIEDLDTIVRLIGQYEPDYLPAAKKFLSGNKLYLGNMFFMKRQLFRRYSAWLFGLLRRFYEARDMEALHYNSEAMRTPGHLGERLLGIFYTAIAEREPCPARNLNILMIDNTDPLPDLAPAFAENNVPVFFATNGKYAMFTATALRSMLEHITPQHNYDVVILHNDLTQDDRMRLSFLARGRANVSVRFLNPEPLFDDYTLYESATITKETYYRLIIPDHFPRYNKILYLDSDLVVLTDIAELYDTDLGGNYIAGAIDICHAGNVNGFSKEMLEYYKQFRFRNIFTLINAGVLLIDTAAMRRDFSAKYLLDFAQQGNFRFQDQDLLNILCEGKILYLDSGWNFFGDPDDSYRGYSRSFAPKPYLEAYLRAKDHIRILHFAGCEKPWLYPDNEYAFLFWEYFRKTPYYERAAGCTLRAEKQSKPRPQGSLLRRIVLRLCPAGTRRRALAKKLYSFIVRRH